MSPKVLILSTLITWLLIPIRSYSDWLDHSLDNVINNGPNIVFDQDNNRPDPANNIFIPGTVVCGIIKDPAFIGVTFIGHIKALTINTVITDEFFLSFDEILAVGPDCFHKFYDGGE